MSAAMAVPLCKGCQLTARVIIVARRVCLLPCMHKSMTWQRLTCTGVLLRMHWRWLLPMLSSSAQNMEQASWLSQCRTLAWQHLDYHEWLALPPYHLCGR